MRASAAAFALALTAPAALAGEPATFTFINLFSAEDVTADGSVVLAWDGDAYLWTAESGGLSIGAVNSVAGIATDGSWVGGTIIVDGKQHAARWSDGTGWEDLGGLEGSSGCDSFLTTAYDISGDGTTVVGLGWEGCSGRAFRWDEGVGMVQLPQMGPNSARANAVSRDGSVVGGWDEHSTGFRRACIWDIEGNETIFNVGLPGETYCLSADGSKAAGQMDGDAFYWTEAEGIVDLGSLPGSGPQAIVLSMTADGTLLMGVSGSFFPFAAKNAFIYEEEEGIMRKLADVLTFEGATIPEGWRLEWAYGASDDGTVIVGTAFNPNTFQNQGFVATRAIESEPCIGDVDGDGTVGVTDLVDLILAWGPCEGCAADTDGNGVVDVTDLVNLILAWGDCH